MWSAPRPLFALCLAVASVFAFSGAPVGARGQAAPGKAVRLAPAEGAVARLPASAKRYALVIGVDQYDDAQITALKGAGNDARALMKALVTYAGFPSDQVFTLTSASADRPTRRNILGRLARLRGVVPADGLLLVAFSGHGIERAGRGFLLPSDAEASDDVELLEQTAVSLEMVRDAIRKTGVKQVIMLVDACRNDPVAGRGGADAPMTAGFSRGFNFDVRNREVEAFATIYATAVGQRAYENARTGQGYFSEAVIEGFAGKAANERKEVTLSGLIEYLQTAVPRRIALDLGTGRVQKPFATIEGYRANDLVIAVSGSEVIRQDEAPEIVQSGKTQFPFVTVTLDARGAVRARGNGEASGYVENLGDGVPLEMIDLPGGSFTMGSNDAEQRIALAELKKSSPQELQPYLELWVKAESPQHKVTVAAFSFGRYEVTQAQWAAVAKLPKVNIELNAHPSATSGDDLPVESVSWDDATEFCARLSRVTGKQYRLPTEAEWEYACRAGSNSPFALGDTLTPDFANYNGAFSYDLGPKGVGRLRTVPIGSLGVANAWGMCDMHGNVFEWCQDWHGTYPSGSANAPAGPGAGAFRVNRGGAGFGGASECRSAFRGFASSNARFPNLGLRVARTSR